MPQDDEFSLSDRLGASQLINRSLMFSSLVETFLMSDRQKGIDQLDYFRLSSCRLPHVDSNGDDEGNDDHN